MSKSEVVSFEIEDTVESCGNCSGVQFYMLSGGGLQCSNCGMVLYDFWIANDGVSTKTFYMKKQSAN